MLPHKPLPCGSAMGQVLAEAIGIGRPITRFKFTSAEKWVAPPIRMESGKRINHSVLVGWCWDTMRNADLLFAADGWSMCLRQILEQQEGFPARGVVLSCVTWGENPRVICQPRHEAIKTDFLLSGCHGPGLLSIAL